MRTAGKKPEDQLFDTMDAGDLNKRLKDLMDGLSVKVLQLPPISLHLPLPVPGAFLTQPATQQVYVFIQSAWDGPP